MSRDQLLTLLILGGLVVLFLWDRLRYDLVALIALLAAVAGGVVPVKGAFSGFANPVLPLIAGALVVSVAIGQSGAVEILLRRLRPLMRSSNLQVGVLVACVALLSAFMKNVGALAIFIPAAVQVARSNNRSPSEFLMPLSFASLLGGSITLIGTSPNLLASTVRLQLTGEPFHMFDFTPVSGGIALCGVAFLTFGWRLLPKGLRDAAGGGFTIEAYTSELSLPAGSPFIDHTIAEVEGMAGGEVAIVSVSRDGGRRSIAAPDWTLFADDLIVVEADPQAIERFVRDGKLALIGAEKTPEKPEDVGDPHPEPQRTERPTPAERELATVEAVVAAGSDLIGHSAAELHLRARHGVNLLAIGRRSLLRGTPLRQVRLRLGDAIVLQGYTSLLPDTLLALGCLPLAERPLNLGRPRQLLLSLGVVGLAILLSGFELVPVHIAFVAAAVAVVLLDLVTLKEAYAAVEWPILVLLGALIPIGQAVEHTGTAKLIAASLTGAAGHLPGSAVLAAVLVATMLITPILHHAAAVLVMGPIAASLAQLLGYHLDPFLMAVAVGAGSDFLSPIGHQSNTLVMGPGGYRFGDYWRLGLPLSLLVVGLGVPLIMIVWPLH